MNFEKAIGGLILVLGVLGVYLFGEQYSHLKISTYPEDYFKLWPSFPGLVCCSIVTVEGIIVLLGSWLRWWQSYSRIVILYIFIFITGFVMSIIGYAQKNETPIVIAISILSIILLITATAALVRKHSPITISSTTKLGALLMLVPFVAFEVLFVMPQWFDAVARSIPDHELREMVRDAIGKPPGYAQSSDLERITRLNSGNYPGIRDLSGLQHFTGLTNLQVSSNSEINDITPLSNLTNLRELWLGGNNISDITPLANLTALTNLYLDFNRISDISPISNLGALVSLDLTGNLICDLEPLVENEGLPNLRYLTLNHNPLSTESREVFIPMLRERGIHVQF